MMEVAVLTKVRNGPLIRYRRKSGLSQAKAAEAAEVSIASWSDVERMRFTSSPAVEAASAIALFLEIPLEEVCPRELVGKSIWLDRVMFRHVTGGRLLKTQYQERMTLPSPEDALEETETNVLQLIKCAELTDRETTIILARYGIGRPCRTHREMGKELGLCAQRIHQIERAALHKMKISNPQSPLNDEIPLAAAGESG